MEDTLSASTKVYSSEQKPHPKETKTVLEINNRNETKNKEGKKEKKIKEN